jgi:hypothetical protein
MKIYELCKSSTGYVCNFVIYTGKDTIYGQKHPGEQTSSRIVLEVSHDLPDKGYCLYLDNWYTSPKLLTLMHQKNRCCWNHDMSSFFLCRIRGKYPRFL